MGIVRKKVSIYAKFRENRIVTNQGLLTMKFDVSYLLSGKYAQWICIALITLFSVLLISECSTLRFSQRSAVPTPAVEVVETKKDHFEYIAKASLFGVHISENLNENLVKKTLLDLTLVGVLFVDKIDESQVIISTPNGEEKTYKIGDTLPGGAVLKRITANGVLVLREGNLESLSLPINELTFEPVPEPLREE
jgi:general secretion pathway protein C